MMQRYEKEIPFETRKKDAADIQLKYPDKRPIIIQPTIECNYVLKKRRYLVDKDMACGELLLLVRKYIKLDAVEALFFYVDNEDNNYKDLLIPSKLISQLYNDHKHSDGFLYLSFTQENVFG